MIIEASHLKKVLDLININFPERVLELVSNDDVLQIGVNYNDNYYIEYTVKIKDLEEFHIIMAQETLDKLQQLVAIWPKCSLQITSEGEHQVVEVIEYGKLIREKPVQVDCIFEEGEKDYKLVAPDMHPNISVNAKNLRQMLEFCRTNEEIILSVEDNSLLVNNVYKTIGTRVEVEEFFSNPKGIMKLSAEAVGLIVSFLTKLGIKAPNVYMLFLKKEHAFSIKVSISKQESIQIYTIHESP